MALATARALVLVSFLFARAADGKFADRFGELLDDMKSDITTVAEVLEHGDGMQADEVNHDGRALSPLVNYTLLNKGDTCAGQGYDEVEDSAACAALTVATSNVFDAVGSSTDELFGATFVSVVDQPFSCMYSDVLYFGNGSAGAADDSYQYVCQGEQQPTSTRTTTTSVTTVSTRTLSYDPTDVKYPDKCQIWFFHVVTGSTVEERNEACFTASYEMDQIQPQSSINLLNGTDEEGACVFAYLGAELRFFDTDLIGAYEDWIEICEGLTTSTESSTLTTGTATVTSSTTVSVTTTGTSSMTWTRTTVTSSATTGTSITSLTTTGTTMSNTGTSSTGTTTTATTTTPTQYVLLDAGLTCAGAGYDEVDDAAECFNNASDFLNLTSKITDALEVQADLACVLQFGEVLFFGNGNPGTADPARQFICKGAQDPSSTSTETTSTLTMTTTPSRFNASKVNEPDVCSMWFFHVVSSNNTEEDRDVRQTLCFEAAGIMTTITQQRSISLLPVGETSNIGGCVFNKGGEEIYFYDQDGVTAYNEWLDLCEGLTTSTESSSTELSSTMTTMTSITTLSTVTGTSSTTATTTTSRSSTTVSTKTRTSSTTGTTTSRTSGTTLTTTTLTSTTMTGTTTTLTTLTTTTLTTTTLTTTTTGTTTTLTSTTWTTITLTTITTTGTTGTSSTTVSTTSTTVTTTTPTHYVLLPAGQTCAEAGYLPIPDAVGCFYNATEYLGKDPQTTVESSDAEHACVVKFDTVWFFGNASYDTASDDWQNVCQGEEQTTSTTTETTSSTSATTTTPPYDPSNIRYPDVCQEWYFFVANGSSLTARHDQCTYVSNTMERIKHYQVQDEDNSTILLDRTIQYVDVSTVEKEAGLGGCVFLKGASEAYYYDSTLSTASNIKVLEAYELWLDTCDGLTTSTESSTMSKTFTATKTSSMSTTSITTGTATTETTMTTESSSTTATTITRTSTSTGTSSTTATTITETSSTTVSFTTETSSTSGTTTTGTSITTVSTTTGTSTTTLSSATGTSTTTFSSRTTASTTTESSSTATETSSTTVTTTGTTTGTTTSVHTTSITGTATITSTFTPERWSQIKCAIGLSFTSNVTDEEVENATLIALTHYLNDSDTLITIDSVTSQDRTDVSSRLLTTGDATFNFQIVYTLQIPGMDTDDAAALLWDLFNNHTAFDATLAEVSASIGMGNISVYYATEPNVINWFFTTITLTSTTATSTTCCVCNLPAVSDVPAGVPVGLLADVEEQVSNRSDLIRIECMGFSWFDTCNPKCGPGYVEAEQMVCANRSLDQKMVPSTFTGEARCERDVCPGSPFNGTVPTGYEPSGPDCTDMLFQDRCNFSCSDGYSDNGIPVQRECLATTTWPDGGPVEYGFANGSGYCTEKSCDEASVPYMSDVSNSSVCVGIGSRTSCSPVCNVSYELVEPVNCTKGQFDEIPLVCVPSEHAEMLELVEARLVRMAIASSDSGSAEGLTAVWANIPSSDAAIKSALVKMLGVLPGQVFVKGKKDLNSDWSSVTPTARRLTARQGLYFEVVLQPTELVNLSALSASSSDLAGGNFIDELTDALQVADVSAPPGLATATFEVGPIEHVSHTLPVARWLARTDWSSCSNACARDFGAGTRTRTVECVGAWGSSATDMCNANAAPGFTMESYMPDSESCEQWTSCAFDWKCPFGPDPVTGEGCETQATGVAIALAAAFLCCCCLLGACLRACWKARPKKTANTARTTERSAHGRATLTPKGGRGAPIGPVDLDFSGAAAFVLQMRVTTTAKDSLLVGKVHRSGYATLQRGGEAKALVIKEGFPAWRVGTDTIYGKTFVADGEQHEISISYSGADNQYVLKVDGTEQARGLHGVADNPDTTLVLGTASAPRDDTANALYPLLEELRRAGVEVSPLEDRAEELLFDGDIDGLTWREYKWSEVDGHMAWLTYDLHIGAEEAIGKTSTRRATVSGSSPQLFHKGQTVEYWSKTVQTWMPAEILKVADPYYDDTLKLYALSFDVYVGAASQKVLGVGMMDLRLPFLEGESVSVFSQKHGSWFPARIHRSRHASDRRGGYDIKLEDVLEACREDGEEVETYFKSELQKDLARFAGDNDESLLKNMTAKRLRRRYDRGERVLVFQGANEGFVEAEVVREEAEDKPGYESVGVAKGVHHDGNPSHGQSPERERASAATRMMSPGGRSPPPRGKAGGGDEGAERNARRYNFSEQRHATVVVTRIRSGRSLPQETMKVPEYALRSPVASGSEDAPPRRSSPSGGGTPEDIFKV